MGVRLGVCRPFSLLSFPFLSFAAIERRRDAEVDGKGGSLLPLSPVLLSEANAEFCRHDRRSQHSSSFGLSVEEDEEEEGGEVGASNGRMPRFDVLSVPPATTATTATTTPESLDLTDSVSSPEKRAELLCGPLSPEAGDAREKESECPGKEEKHSKATRVTETVETEGEEKEKNVETEEECKHSEEVQTESNEAEAEAEAAAMEEVEKEAKLKEEESDALRVNASTAFPDTPSLLPTPPANCHDRRPTPVAPLPAPPSMAVLTPNSLTHSPKDAPGLSSGPKFDEASPVGGSGSETNTADSDEGDIEGLMDRPIGAPRALSCEEDWESNWDQRRTDSEKSEQGVGRAVSLVERQQPAITEPELLQASSHAELTKRLSPNLAEQLPCMSPQSLQFDAAQSCRQQNPPTPPLPPPPPPPSPQQQESPPSSEPQQHVCFTFLIETLNDVR